MSTHNISCGEKRNMSMFFIRWNYGKTRVQGQVKDKMSHWNGFSQRITLHNNHNLGLGTKVKLK